MIPLMSEVTRVLSAIEAGDPQAAAQLLPLVYDELRRLAAQRLAHEKPGQTLEATALVHEAYLRLVDGAQTPQWKGRGHFFAAAAEAMRRILIDNARRKRADKHGGGKRRLNLDQAGELAEASALDLLALDEALDRLTRHDPKAAELVKLHCFAGLTVEQAAGIIELSRTNAYRLWTFARAWLHSQLAEGTDAEA
jgi:RNA polymerase sigma factor (TIGR02999 family)